MTYSHAKIQGQRSVGSKEEVETNGQTDGGERITSLTNAVGKYMEVFVVIRCYYSNSITVQQIQLIDT